MKVKVRDILPLVKGYCFIFDKNNNLLFQVDEYHRNIHEVPKNILKSTIDSMQTNLAQIAIVIKENYIGNCNEEM